MLGLTLEGGGAKGAYQIGAWQAFKEMNLEFQGITGTSVGALNGALMVQEDFEIAYKIWNDIAPHMVMDIDDRIYEMLSGNQLNASNIHIIFEEIRKIVKGFGLDTKPLEKLIKQTLKEEKIRKSKTDFGFVTVSLTDFKPMEIFKEEIPSAKMADYLMASSYLPIFKSKKLDGKNFLDGSFYNNLPIDMLYHKGYKEIVAVRLLSRGRIKKTDYPDLKVICIQPNQDLGNIMDFTKKRAQRNIRLGYFDTIKVFKGLKGKNYYIETNIQEEEALKFLMNINEEAIRELAELYSLSPSKASNRLLLEDIIPRWVSFMGLEENASYKDVMIGLVEGLGHYNQIDPFHIYTLSELFKKSMEAYKKSQRNNKNSNMGLLIKAEFLLKLKKEKLLEETIKILCKHHKMRFD
ncbi:NTE family protein [Natronincola peptidivorans]|uniref:NTE family protein n=1 Tax=Natronincola peptidivorans TaxID=426128 RepID=A0A1I0ANG7_9FIRM|nr:patatin-like phospholipase family protein [Natronincola peptidivorans]SES95898.1 NTE family protein [Natronincola peptidivorans]